MTRDLKIGQYTKLPPRVTFTMYVASGGPVERIL